MIKDVKYICIFNIKICNIINDYIEVIGKKIITQTSKLLYE